MTIQEIHDLLQEISEKLDLITRSDSFNRVLGHPEYSTGGELTIGHAHQAIDEIAGAIAYVIEEDEEEAQTPGT